MTRSWTESDFEKMSWHDNHVHGLAVRAGEYGSGELLLDLDYIEEWIKAEDGSCRFRIVPSELRFREVTSLRIEVDWATPTASLGPFSLDRIARSDTEHGRGHAWELVINWPAGRIAFEAMGYDQRPTSDPVVSDQQMLAPDQRRSRG